jgi:hypothetical protein
MSETEIEKAERLRQAVIDGTGNGDTLLTLCALLQKRGVPIPLEIEEAWLIFHLQADPENVEMLQRLCSVLGEQGKTVPFELEERTLIGCLRQFPERADLRARLELVQRHLGKLPVSRLKVICVGTGRDGTSSLAQMFTELFHRAGVAYQAENEYKSREIFQNFCDYRESGNPQYLDTLRNLIADCPYDCIVCNAAAPILPMLVAHVGKGLKLVHLRRADRTRCIASLKENSELFPSSYKYYSQSPEARFKRMAAFHFNEMTAEAWGQLSAEEKFSWYYDKTHELVNSFKHLFSETLDVTTESMNNEVTRRALARLILGTETVFAPPVFTNPHFLQVGTLSPEKAELAQWMLQYINLLELGNNPTYLLEYGVERVLRFLRGATQAEVEGTNGLDAQHRNELIDSISKARSALASGLDQLIALDARLNSTGA